MLTESVPDRCPSMEKTTMLLQDRIVVDPDILVGKPVVHGTRLSVDFLVGLMAQE